MIGGLRWNGRFGFEQVYVNWLNIPTLNVYQQPAGDGP